MYKCMYMYTCSITILCTYVLMYCICTCMYVYIFASIYVRECNDIQVVNVKYG